MAMAGVLNRCPTEPVGLPDVPKNIAAIRYGERNFIVTGIPVRVSSRVAGRSFPGGTLRSSPLPGGLAFNLTSQTALQLRMTAKPCGLLYPNRRPFIRSALESGHIALRGHR